MTDRAIQLRRIGERRAGLLRRMRPEYEIVIRDGETVKYRATTTRPGTALVTQGNVHTTDSWDWIEAANDAYARNDEGWISDPFRGYGSK